MYTSQQNIIEHCTDMVQQGKLSADDANVKMIRMEGVRIVKNKIPGRTRKALNRAVKAGELGHFKKDGYLPEVYFHPNSRVKAIEARERVKRNTLNLSGTALRGH